MVHFLFSLGTIQKIEEIYNTTIFFFKKKRSTIYVPIYSMYSKLRLKFTLASRFMRKKYKRMLKVHFEIKLK